MNDAALNSIRHLQLLLQTVVKLLLLCRHSCFAHLELLFQSLHALLMPQGPCFLLGYSLCSLGVRELQCLARGSQSRNRCPRALVCLDLQFEVRLDLLDLQLQLRLGTA